MKITGISTIALALLLTAGLAAMTLSGAFAVSMDNKVALTNDVDSPPLPPDPDALWAYLIQSKYRTWRQFPDHRGVQIGNSPHGQLHQVFVNDAGREATGKVLPRGTIIAKDNYNLSQVLMAVTVMYKVEGYNPEAGDWYWVKYAPDGTADASGRVDGCIGCHRARADNDWVQVQDL